MIGKMARSTARNLFFFGSLFCFVVFSALIIQTHLHMLDSFTDPEGTRASVEWDQPTRDERNCTNCDSTFGDGAYSAPELENSWDSYSGGENPEGNRADLNGWMKSQSPKNLEGREFVIGE